MQPWLKCCLPALLLLMCSRQRPAHASASTHPILEHWLQLVSAHHATTVPNISGRAAAMRATAAFSLLPASCLYLYTYTAASRTIDIWPSEQRHPCGMPTALDRAKIYKAFMTALVLQDPKHAPTFDHDFSFLLDVIDGHRQNHAARLLGVPLLVLSKHPMDNYTIPFPDLYHVLGLLTLQYKLTGKLFSLSELAFDWQRGSVEGRSLQILALAASFALQSTPWKARHTAAAYRGSCYSTANSSDSSPTVRAFAARAQLARLCSSHHKRSSPDYQKSSDTSPLSQFDRLHTNNGSDPVKASDSAQVSLPRLAAALGVASGSTANALPVSKTRRRRITACNHCQSKGCLSRRQLFSELREPLAVAQPVQHLQRGRGCLDSKPTGYPGRAEQTARSAAEASLHVGTTHAQPVQHQRSKPKSKQERLDRAAAVAAWGSNAMHREQREAALAAALEDAQLPAEALDIGLIIKGYNTTCVNNLDAPKLCAACKLCYAAAKPQLTLQELLQYKYQILVDGYSAAWDASLWKFGSNSTVFYVHPQQHHDGSPHQPWTLWWYPALTPGKHYISTTATDLPLHLAQCLTAEDKCRRMAEAAYTVVKRSVSLESTLEYTYLLLKYLHDLQAP